MLYTSTRPFLSQMEKRWIIFQLLKVLEECDQKKINHGDMKSENVLLTSWNWVMLSDFASFKPTLLPDVSNSPRGGEGGGERERERERDPHFCSHSLHTI